MPPEVFEALPPEVFGFGFGPAGDPGELLGQAAANALALQADADQMILDARAADADPNRLELLNATAKRMSAAATELAVVVARAEGLGDEISALGAQRQRANQAVDAARAALATAPSGPARTAAQVALDDAQAQADAAGADLAEVQSAAVAAAAEVTLAEAEGDVATAEAAVLAADFPLALFAAKIALALLARQNAVEALKAAAVVPAF